MKIRTDKVSWMRDFNATPQEWTEYCSLIFQKRIVVDHGIIYEVRNLKLKNDVLTYTLGEPVEPSNLPKSLPH